MEWECRLGEKTSLQYKFVQIFALSNSCKNKFLSISTNIERKVIQAILSPYGLFLGQVVTTKCKFYKIVDEANLGRSVNEYEMKKKQSKKPLHNVYFVQYIFPRNQTSSDLS